MRILARISYDGSKFMGFQRLENGKGVQNELERVLSILAKKEVVIKGAGRTDAGVHALDQCVHFDLDLSVSLKKLKYIMNRMLSPYIAVQSLEQVDKDFHARFLVKEKTYVYKIYCGKKNPFYSDYAYFFPYTLDLEKMQECANLFLKEHDFHNFVSGSRDSYQSFISSLKIRKDKNFITIEVCGKSFYRYMVRSIVGAILDVGRGAATCSSVSNALNTSEEKRFSVVPAMGLYLTKIVY